MRKRSHATSEGNPLEGAGAETRLSSRTCVPCRKGSAPLSTEERDALLPLVSGWSLSPDGSAISRRYSFPDFKTALHFANAVGAVSEEAGHHPDLTVGWGYVTVIFITHHVRGLTLNDFILAARVGEIPADLS